MNICMPHELLRTAAARYVLGVASSDYLKQAANDVLNAGMYSPGLAEIATTYRPIMSDVGPLLEQAMQELDLAIPNKEEALWHAASYHLKRIADREISPRAGMAYLKNDVVYPGLYDRSLKFLGDSHDLHELLGLYYAYDDIDGRPGEVSIEGKYGDEAKAALDTGIITEAKAWLTRHRDRIAG